MPVKTNFVKIAGQVSTAPQLESSKGDSAAFLVFSHPLTGAQRQTGQLTRAGCFESGITIAPMGLIASGW